MVTMCYTDEHIGEKIIISYRNQKWKLENLPNPGDYPLDKYTKFIININNFMELLNNTKIEE